MTIVNPIRTFFRYEVAGIILLPLALGPGNWAKAQPSVAPAQAAGQNSQPPVGAVEPASQAVRPSAQTVEPTAQTHQSPAQGGPANTQTAETQGKAMNNGPGANAAKDAESIGTLDQSLAQAMDKNPQIISAKAKVALAQAELNRTRLDVARQLITLWNDQKALENAVESNRRKFRRIQALRQTAAVSAETSDDAQTALIDTEAKLSRIRGELRSISGELVLVGAITAPGTPPANAAVQMPRGPIVEQIRQALDHKINLNQEGNTDEILHYLRDQSKIPIVHDENMGADAGVKLQFEGTTLSACLQAVEDQLRGSQFVVRDYGILLTDRDHARQEGFMPLSEFVTRLKVH